jgi:hypothetical protein
MGNALPFRQEASVAANQPSAKAELIMRHGQIAGM